MRRTIRRRKSGIKKDKLITFFTFFVFAPIVSILLGIALVRYLILPYFESNDTTNIINEKNVDVAQDSKSSSGNNENPSKEIPEDDTRSEDISLESALIKPESNTLYSIQVGNFTDIDNAQELLKQIKDNKLSGYIIKTDGYKVLAGTFFSRGEADEYIQDVKSIYTDVFVSTMTIQGKELNFQKEDKNYVDELSIMIEEVNSAFGEESSLWASGLKMGDLSLLKEVMNQNNDNLTTKMKQILDKPTSQEVNDLLSDVGEIFTQREQIIMEIGENKEVNQSNYENFMKVLFEYINLIS